MKSELHIELAVVATRVAHLRSTGILLAIDIRVHGSWMETGHVNFRTSGNRCLLHYNKYLC